MIDNLYPVKFVVANQLKYEKDIIKIEEDIKVTKGDLTLVQFHKARLGEQTGKINDIYWYWDYPEYRVIISNSYGVEFAVKKQDCSMSWDHIVKSYKEKIGFLATSIRYFRVLKNNTIPDSYKYKRNI